MPFCFLEIFFHENFVVLYFSKPVTFYNSIVVFSPAVRIVSALNNKNIFFGGSLLNSFGLQWLSMFLNRGSCRKLQTSFRIDMKSLLDCYCSVKKNSCEMSEDAEEKSKVVLCLKCHACSVQPGRIYNERMEPLSKDTMMLAECIQNVAGYCTVTGSAPLAQLRSFWPFCSNCSASQNLRKVLQSDWVPGDVDFVVPMYPRQIDLIKGKQVKKVNRRLHFTRLFRHYIMPHFKHSFMTQKNISWNYIRFPAFYSFNVHGNYNQYDYNDFLKIFYGLRGRIEVCIWNDRSHFTKINILLRNIVPDAFQSWDERATQDFDIDVCQIIAKSSFQENFVPRMEFVSLQAYLSFLNGSFCMTIRPCEPFQVIIQRMEKYQERGFKCSEIKFHQYVTQEWKQYILDSFREHLCYTWFCQMERKAQKMDPDFSFGISRETNPIYKKIKEFACPTYHENRIQILSNDQMNHLERIRRAKRQTQF